MIYDETYLVEKVLSLLEEEYTNFDDYWVEYDDTAVRLNGHVFQTFEYKYSTDHHLLSGMELVSRTADFDEILVANKDGERCLTVEELFAIERMIDK